MRVPGIAPLAALLLVSSSPATAVDGVIEINDTRAYAGGITGGDAPGYPVTLSSAGSYRLTGNLYQATTGHAIEITAANVTLDLNGFRVVCAFPPCNALQSSLGGVLGLIRNGVLDGDVDGLSGTELEDLRVVGDISCVSDCSLRRVRASDISCNSFCRLEDVRAGALSNPGSNCRVVRSKLTSTIACGVGCHILESQAAGITAGDGALISDYLQTNGLSGIVCGAGCRIRDSAVSGVFGADGVSVGRGSNLSGVTSQDNDGHGIVSAEVGVKVSGSVANGNGGDGIRLLGVGSSVLGSVSSENDGDGIQITGGGLVADSTVAGNTGVLGGSEGDGIRGTGTGVNVLRNVARNNAGDGIELTNSTGVVTFNTVYNNGNDGIEVRASTVVIGNSARDNAGYGLRFTGAGNSAYKDNLVELNTTGTVTGNGVQTGNNLCNGNTTCP